MFHPCYLPMKTTSWLRKFSIISDLTLITACLLLSYHRWFCPCKILKLNETVNPWNGYFSKTGIFLISFAKGSLITVGVTAKFTSIKNVKHSTWCIWDALRDLLTSVKFKKCEKHPCRSVNFSKAWNFTKSNTVHIF